MKKFKEVFKLLDRAANLVHLVYSCLDLSGREVSVNPILTVRRITIVVNHEEDGNGDRLIRINCTGLCSRSGCIPACDGLPERSLLGGSPKGRCRAIIVVRMDGRGEGWLCRRRDGLSAESKGGGSFGRVARGDCCTEHAREKC